MPSPELSEPFAGVLRARRAELNTRFAEARHRLAALDPAAFGDFLRASVDPVVHAVHAAHPDRAEAVALAAYDVTLELIGQRVAGPGARGSAIDRTWQRVGVAAARAVAAEPERVLASLSNAAHQVAATPNADIERWIDDLERLAPACSSADDLLRVGQIAAWHAGLAHYRAGAVSAAAALPEALALRAVGAPASSRWKTIEAGLTASEWFDPARADTPAAAAPRVVSTVGAFRGFGGPFTEPPRVTFHAGHFRLTSGDETWLLVADLFGATFHRLTSDEALTRAPSAKLPRGLDIGDDGTLTVRERSAKLAGPGKVTSAAASETTLAVTWSLTHQVTLVALA